MVEETTNQLFPKIVNTVRAASALSAQDVDFYRSLDKNVAKSLDQTSAELVSMINSTLLCIDQNSKMLEEGKEKLENSRKDFGNLMDNLFEKSDRSLDILKGKAGERKDGRSLMYLDDGSRDDSMPSRRILKPQLTFKRPVDNTETHPFKPLLKSKPHALKTLTESVRILPADEDVPEHYPQPYEYEIDRQEYSDNVLTISDPIPPRPWEEGEAIWVDNEETLKSMVSELKDFTEIAVDLEHHDYRSYYGIVCLMQISTRKTDYLVDTLALRHGLGILNTVFADPSIVKVFHGAFMDIIWLQRDLGLYVVGLFDTYHASRALGFPRHSLAYLLETLASFKTSKKYQLADWRVRPLSKPLNAYARADTHFLLNIYDQLRNRLIVGDKLAGVLFESRNVAKRSFQYAKYRPKVPTPSVYSPIDRADGWRVLMRQYNIPAQKQELVKILYEWRDTIARRDDESPRYVMPNQLLAYLVDYAPLDPASVMSVSPTMTDHVRSNSKFLANLIGKCLQDIKDTDNLDETTQFGIKTKGDNDLSQVLTIPQIKSKVSQFRSFSRSLNGLKSQPTNTSPLIFGNLLVSPSTFVEYVNGQRHQLSNEQIRQRKQELSQAFKAMDNSITMVQEPAEKPAPKVASEGQNPLLENRAGDHEADKKEDMEEIIRLRKVENRGKKPVRSGALEQEEEDTIDYSGVKKVLETDKKKRPPKRRAFDPYSASNETGQAPKPKKRRTMGKNKSVSFKH